MKLNRHDIQMTKGIAIISMLLLHLFCRKNIYVYGMPLVWIKDGVPLVYYLGFLSEICVPLYSMCSGYAHFCLGENNKLKFNQNKKRILRFLLNYWIVLILFCIVGFVVKDPNIPGSLEKFIFSFTLLKIAYNGAWWYVATYVLLVLFSKYVYKFVNNTNVILVGLIAIGQYIIFYLFGSMFYGIFKSNLITEIIARQVVNYFGDVLLCYVAGMIIAKYDVVNLVKRLVKKSWMIIVLIVVSVMICIFEKAIIIPFYAMLVFIVFNGISKSKYIKNSLMYLGKHSTNIWLVHMFFYLTLFPGFVQQFKYPLFMFLALLGICLICSYIINCIYNGISKLVFK